MSLITCWLSLTVAVIAQVPVDKIMIDPLNGAGGSASQIYSEVNYIPLETNKESLFGEIEQLAVTPEYFIVLDKTTDAILFFNKDGSYHHKISKFPFDKIFTIPPGFRQHKIRDFRVDTDKQQLQVKSIFENDVLYLFDFEGKLQGKLLLPYSTIDQFFLKDGTVFYRQQRPYSKDKTKGYQPYDISFLKDSGTAQYLFPVNFAYVNLPTEIGNAFPSFYGNADRCFYTPDLDNNVYELDASGITHQYHFVFPMQFSLPDNFAYDSTYTNKRREFINKKDYITHIIGFSRIRNYLIFELKMLTGKPESTDYVVLYSLTSKNTILLDRVSGDTSSYYLPVGLGRSNPLTKILAADEDSFYGSYSSVAFFYAKDAGTDKAPVYNTVLKNYFTTQSRKSNPVIIQLKPKGNL